MFHMGSVNAGLPWKDPLKESAQTNKTQRIPCMAYLPTFTIKRILPYMDPMGKTIMDQWKVTILETNHLFFHFHEKS